MFALITFQLFTYLREKRGFSDLVFHLFWFLSFTCTFLLLHSYDPSPSNSSDLYDFILKNTNTNNYELIDNSRTNFCFDCMVVHKVQMFHCKKGKGCIQGYQKYSQMFGKSVGAHNYLIYYLNCVFALVMTFLWIRQSIWSMVNRVEVDINRYRLIFWLDAMFKLWSYSKVLAIIQSKCFLVLTNLF